MRLTHAVSLLAACAPQHVAPVARSNAGERASVVSVRSECSEAAFDAVEWMPPRLATGVIVSDRYVLTAAHAVFCPTIPEVTIELRDGRVRRAFVERDDAMFPHAGSGSDLARIELPGGGLGAVPPELGAQNADAAVCVQLWRGQECGAMDAYHLGQLDGVHIAPGDSGAPVYGDGSLVGIVVGGDGDDHAALLEVAAYWLEGT